MKLSDYAPMQHLLNKQTQYLRAKGAEIVFSRIKQEVPVRQRILNTDPHNEIASE